MPHIQAAAFESPLVVASNRGPVSFHRNADGELTGPFRSRRWELRAAAFTMMLPTPDQAVPSN